MKVMSSHLSGNGVTAAIIESRLNATLHEFDNRLIFPLYTIEF